MSRPRIKASRRNRTQEPAVKTTNYCRRCLSSSDCMQSACIPAPSLLRHVVLSTRVYLVFQHVRRVIVVPQPSQQFLTCPMLWRHSTLTDASTPHVDLLNKWRRRSECIRIQGCPQKGWYVNSKVWVASNGIRWRLYYELEREENEEIVVRFMHFPPPRHACSSNASGICWDVFLKLRLFTSESYWVRFKTSWRCYSNANIIV